MEPALLQTIQILNDLYPKKFISIHYEINSHYVFGIRQIDTIWILSIDGEKNREFADEFKLIRYVVDLAAKKFIPKEIQIIKEFQNHITKNVHKAIDKAQKAKNDKPLFVDDVLSKGGYETDN